jgi:pyruvate dehydrogenase E2 component (dihydrolipoamide acetyltransferase)
MASRVIMPKLTDSMEEGVVVKWRKAEGERVESGDVLAEIETDKAVMDLEAFGSGTLRKILVPEGTTVASGTLIGIIAEPDEDIQTLSKEPPGSAPKPAASTGPRQAVSHAAGQAETVSTAPSPASEATASPRVRTLAREHGVDLGQVKGSGPGGRIIERDIEALVPKQETQAPARPQSGVQEVPLSQMRKAVARITTQSKAPIPHFYVTIEVDMAAGLAIVEESKSSGSPVSINHLIIAASARALRQHPGVNAAFAGDVIRLFSSIDIGMAVSVEDGLIVPVLRDCGNKTLAQIAEEERALVSRTRHRELAPEEYSNPTFLVSNLGMYDVENFIAVILPPAATALAVGSVREVPVARDGRVEVGRRVKMTLSCDHRVIDGTSAAKFLQTLKQELQRPTASTLPSGEKHSKGSAPQSQAGGHGGGKS